jgi:hypothetical protein
MYSTIQIVYHLDPKLVRFTTSQIMVWLHRSPILVGEEGCILLVKNKMITIPAFAALAEGGGGGGQHPLLATHSSPVLAQSEG